MLVDSHCHLADEQFAGDLSEVIDRARAAGLTAALCILSADEADELARSAAVKREWAAIQFAAAVHPHHAGLFADAPSRAADVAAAALDQCRGVALGEIGLDYHYDFAPKATQREVFAAQVALAVERNLPVIIHTREATDDTIAVLREASPAVRGVIHCFSGTRADARLALDLGFYISLSGIVTFPKATELREVAAFVPSDRLLVETDAPYLAPMPYRGRRNEPAWVTETVTVVAASRGVTPETLLSTVAANTAAFVPALASAGEMSR